MHAFPIPIKSIPIKTIEMLSQSLDVSSLHSSSDCPEILQDSDATLLRSWNAPVNIILHGHFHLQLHSYI